MTSYTTQKQTFCMRRFPFNQSGPREYTHHPGHACQCQYKYTPPHKQENIPLSVCTTDPNHSAETSVNMTGVKRKVV